MTFDHCLIHALLNIFAYLLLGMAGAGGGIYLFLRTRKLPESIKDDVQDVYKMRYRINRIYLITGFILFVIGLIAGFVQAKIVWGAFWVGDFKQISTLIVFTYYLVIGVVYIYTHYKKYERADVLISALALGGVPLIIFDIIVVNLIFTVMHAHF